MDEFALHKGNRYATVVVEPTQRQVLWVGHGRSRETAQARKFVKSARWLLLRERKGLNPAQKVRLGELLEANQALLTVYLLRVELKRVWYFRREGWALKAWKNWFDHAMSKAVSMRCSASPTVTRNTSFPRSGLPELAPALNLAVNLRGELGRRCELRAPGSNLHERWRLSALTGREQRAGGTE